MAADVVGPEHLLTKAAVFASLDARIRRAGAVVSSASVVTGPGDQDIAVSLPQISIGQGMGSSGEGNEDEMLESHDVFLG